MMKPLMEETPVKRKLHEGHALAVILALAAGGYLLYNSVIASYDALVKLATRVGVEEPWRVALTGEISLLVIVVWDIVFTWCSWHAPVLRWVARTLTILSVVINAAAGWPDVRAMLVFLPAPLVILAIVESVRHVLLSKHRVRDPIPFARRWHHHAESRELRRFMVKWEIPSYRVALGMQQRIMAARKQLEVALGPAWRSVADADLVWMLDDAAPATLELALARAAEIYDDFQRARAESAARAADDAADDAAADAEADKVIAALRGADPTPAPPAGTDPSAGAEETPALDPAPAPPSPFPAPAPVPAPRPKPAPKADATGKGGKKALGRELWDARMAAGGPPPETAELVQHTGAGDSTARGWRAEWITELQESAVAVVRPHDAPPSAGTADPGAEEASASADERPTLPRQFRNRRQYAAARVGAGVGASADPGAPPSADPGAGTIALTAPPSAETDALADMFAGASR
ncbi:hypothetical protein [Streptosporangium sp. NPDC002524]|uniref:hypothetical protein n=1 Tax=Streptosporangium sp. NPDC002524 TaxID=3154537 RepID=UPI0033295A05